MENKPSTCGIHPKCASCNPRLCCTFTGLTVPTPVTRGDYSNLLFHVSHENVEVMRKGDVWIVMFRTRCDHLQEDGMCGIYENRPDVCKWYPVEGCERDIPLGKTMDMHFLNYDQLLAYVNTLDLPE